MYPDNRIAVLAVDKIGGLYDAWWYAFNQTWGGWSVIRNAPPFIKPGPAVVVTSDERWYLDAFAIADDGRAYTAWLRPDPPQYLGTKWDGWGQVATPPAGAVKLLAPPAAVVSGRDPATGQANLDVFAVGDDGLAYTAWWRPSTPQWRGWLPVGTPPPAHLLPGLAAVVTFEYPATGECDLDVFAVGDNGQAYTAWWRVADQQWWGWNQVAWAPLLGKPAVGVKLLAPPAAVVSVDPATDQANLDVFAVGEDGLGYTAWWRASTQQWLGWSPMAPLPWHRLMLLPAPAAVVSGRDPATGQANLDVFAGGTDGRIYTAWWRASQGGWQGWSQLATPPIGKVKLLPGPAAVVSEDPATDQGDLDVFAVADNGAVYTAWWRVSTQLWEGWSAVATRPPEGFGHFLPAPAAVARKTWLF